LRQANARIETDRTPGAYAPCCIGSGTQKQIATAPTLSAASNRRMSFRARFRIAKSKTTKQFMEQMYFLRKVIVSEKYFAI